MNRKIIVLTTIGIIGTLIAPFLFTRDWTGIDFTATGNIGDTIGGITAPIIGILSILLLVYTLREQINFNIKQKEISIDEQFKSTFFNLLQVQRDILDRISGNFSYLETSVDKEYVEPDNEIKIIRKETEFATIKQENQEVKGLDFFKSARYQLTLIFQSLDYKEFYHDYDIEQAFEAEMDLQGEIIGGANIPPEIEKEQDEKINMTRMPFRVAYINDKYKITKNIFEKYKELPIDKKIGLGYAYFFNKYESVGYYFRHIYQILKFIKTEEEKKINSLEQKTSSKDKELIHLQFKQYAQFIQAQMSTNELLLLYYNSFAFEKAQKLIVYYDLLENLTVQNLIKADHNCKTEMKLKDKKNIFLELITENK